MNFTDKYISQTEMAEKPDLKKIVITDDAFAIGELLQELINKIEHTRLSLI